MCSKMNFIIEETSNSFEKHVELPKCVGFRKIFFFFFGHTCGMWNFQGQGLNLRHSSNLSHSSGSLTYKNSFFRRKLAFSFCCFAKVKDFMCSVSILKIFSKTKKSGVCSLVFWFFFFFLVWYIYLLKKKKTVLRYLVETYRTHFHL